MRFCYKIALVLLAGTSKAAAEEETKRPPQPQLQGRDDTHPMALVSKIQGLLQIAKDDAARPPQGDDNPAIVGAGADPEAVLRGTSAKAGAVLEADSFGEEYVDPPELTKAVTAEEDEDEIGPVNEVHLLEAWEEEEGGGCPQQHEWCWGDCTTFSFQVEEDGCDAAGPIEADQGPILKGQGSRDEADQGPRLTTHPEVAAGLEPPSDQGPSLKDEANQGPRRPPASFQVNFARGIHSPPGDNLYKSVYQGRWELLRPARYSTNTYYYLRWTVGGSGWERWGTGWKIFWKCGNRNEKESTLLSWNSWDMDENTEVLVTHLQSGKVCWYLPE